MLSPFKSSVLQYQQCHYHYQIPRALWVPAWMNQVKAMHEHAQEERIQTMYQTKRLLSIKRARASCGVGGTSRVAEGRPTFQADLSGRPFRPDLLA